MTVSHSWDSKSWVGASDGPVGSHDHALCTIEIAHGPRAIMEMEGKGALTPHYNNFFNNAQKPKISILYRKFSWSCPCLGASLGYHSGWPQPVWGVNLLRADLLLCLFKDWGCIWWTYTIWNDLALHSAFIQCWLLNSCHGQSRDLWSLPTILASTSWKVTLHAGDIAYWQAQKCKMEYELLKYLGTSC